MIRKWLIKAMKHLSEESTFFLKVPKDKVIAWLEKQGEQKPIDKVEPKFKLGDWVVHKETGTIHQIQQCVEMPTAHTYGYDLTDGGYINTFRTDEYRLWTIQDAKDGDVLYIHSFESDCVFLYQNTYEIEPNRNVAVAYCCIDVYANIIEFGIQGPDCIDVRNVKPATKEQRDLLFQKMKEAGYEWDAEKKELKKIEQKPISIVDDWIEDYWKHYKVNNPDSYDKGEEIQFDHDGFVRFCQTHCPKPAWSEEDEKMWITISDLLWEGYKLSDKKVSWDKIRCWLLPKITYFKDRVQTHPKQEWSENDEKLYTWCASAIQTRYNDGLFTMDEYRETSLWLKSIKEKHTWKPSDEQMKQLGLIAEQNKDNMIGKELMSLYQELKKLKGE